MNIEQIIVIAVSLFLAVWYLAFSIINRKRGLSTYDWLQEGVRKFGTISQASWIGSSGSGARLVVDKPEKPFQRVEVVYLLASREILPLWVVNLARGKRDEMILKASLRSAPKLELEVARPGNRELQEILRQPVKPAYQFLSPDGENSDGVDRLHNLEMIYRGQVDSQALAELVTFLNHYASSLRRISLQRKKPHLILRSDLPDLETGPALEFFEGLQTWLLNV